MGDQKAGEGFPRVDRVTALAAYFLHIRTVEDFEGQPETTFQFIFPLEQHGWRAGHHDIADAATEE